MMSKTAVSLWLLVLFGGCSRGDLAALQAPALCAPSTTAALASFQAGAHVSGTGSSALSVARSPAARQAALRRGGRGAAPLSLTTSDGRGLELVALRAQAALEGPLALTELSLTFRNPEDRVLEGRFSITLPPSAAISRLAMKVDGQWQEAEVIERQQARQTYEVFLHRRQDPALLEHEAGNTYSARVFPIPPRADKEIKVTYSEELTGSRLPYRLYLKGLPQIGHLEVTALVGWPAAVQRAASLGARVTERQLVRVLKEQWIPDQDFVLEPDRSIAGLVYDNRVVVRAQPRLPSRAEPLSNLLVLVDTSASVAPQFPAQVERLGALLAAVVARRGPTLPLKVACFDQSIEPVHEGPAGGFGREQLEQILARQALGASNLSGALSWARGLRGYRRVLLATDGMATAGARKGAALRDAVGALRGAVERLDVLLVDGARDEALLGRLVAGTLRHDGVVLNSALGSDELVQRLEQATFSGIEVTVPGARWIWPAVLDGLQAEDERLVYAELEGQGHVARRQLAVHLSGPINQTAHVRLEPAERRLLERAHAQAQIRRLEHRRDTLGSGSAAEAARVRAEIVALSMRHRVLSDYTAMLVLESDGDYERLGIDRRALADILVVGPSGVDVLKRSSLTGPPAHKVDKGREHRGEEGKMGSRPSRQMTGLYGLKGPAGSSDPHLARRLAEEAGKEAGMLGLLRSASGSHIAAVFGSDTSLGADAEDALGGVGGNEVGEAHGAGAFGTRDRGAAGYGRGVGHLAGPTARVPRAVGGTAEVRGSLDREIIRRIIRRHLAEVRYCYARELEARPELSGRLVVRFVIDPQGQVAEARVTSSTLGNAAVEQCVTQAVRRWLFPRPAGGGTVVVTYPFLLRFEASDEPARPEAPTPLRDANREQRTERRPWQAIEQLLRSKQTNAALAEALRWRAAQPNDELALISLGQAFVASGYRELAARAYGSLIDLHPAHAESRRYAGERLESMGAEELALAVDTYAVTLEERPDHVTGYRLLAYALARQGALEQAFAAIERGLRQKYPPDRFAGYARVLREDLGIIGATWLHAAPARRAEIVRRIEKLGAQLARAPSLRFVLQWESDANDVDLHVTDRKGDHAYYQSRSLPSGGSLYGDVTTGYGPECFAIEGKPRGYPYRLSIEYFSQGAMGYGLGTVQVIAHDGAGRLRVDGRPFVALRDHATVDLGLLAGPP